MATPYQLKIFGRWRDVVLPWVSLAAIHTAIERSGEKPKSTEMKFFNDLCREKWGDMFLGRDETKFMDREYRLEIDCVMNLVPMAVVTKNDSLKIAVCWETKHELPEREGNRRWESADGFVEITLLPGN